MIEYIGLSSLLILAVLALRALVGGHISQRARYGLWLLVALRLLIPFQVGSSALSLVPMLQEVRGLWSGQVSGSGAGELSAGKENGRPWAVGGENGQSGTAGGEDSPLMAADGGTEQRNVSAAKNGRPGAAGAGNGQIPAASEKDGQPADVAAAGKTLAGTGRTGSTGGPSVWIWLSLWLSGAVLAGGCLVWANLRFWLRIKKERYRLPDVPGYLPVYGASCVRTPCLYGLLRPAIYLPADMAETALEGEHGCPDHPARAARQEAGVPDARLAHILAHEQTHYSHGDHIWAFVRCLCLSIHWYNPFVWVAVGLSRRDSELACDEGAVRRLGEASRKAYGATLIEVAAGERETARRAVCFTCLWNGKKEMEKRLHILVRRPRTTAGTAVLAAAFMVLFAGCAFSNPAGDGSGGVSLTGADGSGETDGGAAGQDISGGGDAGQDAQTAGAGDLTARTAGTKAADGPSAGKAEEPVAGEAKRPAADGSEKTSADDAEDPAGAEASGMPGDGEIYLLDEPVEGKVCIAVNPVNMHPPTGRYFHIPHREAWRSNWEEATGYGPENAYTYYYVPDDSVQAELQQMMAGLDETKGVPEDSQQGGRMIGYSLCYEGNTWDVYEDGSLYCYQSDDDTLEFTEALEKNEALCDMVAGILKEKLGYEPVDPDRIRDITSATMVYTRRRGGNEGVPQSQTVTDPAVLRQIEKLIRQARYLHGGSGCSFYEAVLTVALPSGEEIRMAVASDSCAVFLINGMYYDYQPKGAGGQLFQYFDRIVVDGLEDRTDTDEASDGNGMPVTPGRYVVKRKGHAGVIDPYVLLDKDGTCSFFYSVLDSYAFYGTYEVDEEENTVTLTDDLYSYVFTYSGGELIFDADRSSGIRAFDGGVVSVADGEVFSLQDEP